jgi:hypothetical protein
MKREAGNESFLSAEVNRKTIGMPGHIWEDSVKKVLKEKGCQGVDWIHLAQDSVQFADSTAVQITLETSCLTEQLSASKK